MPPVLDPALATLLAGFCQPPTTKVGHCKSWPSPSSPFPTPLSPAFFFVTMHRLTGSAVGRWGLSRRASTAPTWRPPLLTTLSFVLITENQTNPPGNMWTRRPQDLFVRSSLSLPPDKISHVSVCVCVGV
ncbi:uncharacterized protein PV09_03513 [Verruconis gallopava]|uniref:Uncharacterized protein n=1 Tax=Verruconis gallopava TaxID=253628 RepID=A0A0D2AGF2_9PEZI|nr:uncharacterized protein PV09_03513 [Verruconis gallopava]KIW05645.1 hypothetical protein PV09_03513 [Verruconis gallopava]